MGADAVDIGTGEPMARTQTSAQDGANIRLLPARPSFWLSLALACALVWYEVAFRTAVGTLITLPFECLNRPRSDVAWLLALAAMAIGAALAFVPAVRTRLSHDKTAEMPRSTTVKSLFSQALFDPTGLVIAIVCASGTATMYLGAELTGVAWAGGALAGAGFSLLCLRLVYLAPPRRRTHDIFYEGCGALVWALAIQAIFLLVGTVATRVLLCLAPIAMVALVQRARAVHAGLSPEAQPNRQPQESQLKSHITVVCLCFLGLGAYMGIIGFANDSLQDGAYLNWQFANSIAGCAIACLVLWLAARASVEGPYVVSPIMLGTAVLVLVLTVMSGVLDNNGSGEVLAHMSGRATDALLFVMAACTMTELTYSNSPKRLYAPATVLLLCAAALLVGIVAGGVMMSVVGLTVLSTAIVAASLLYGALLSLGVSVQQRSRESYVIVRSSQDMTRIADAQARSLGAELGTLTPREAEVLPYLLQHQSVEAIAQKLGVSRNTIKSHVAHIYEKAGVNARQQLIDLAAAKVINL